MKAIKTPILSASLKPVRGRQVSGAGRYFLQRLSFDEA
ncbi:hypothetical protein FHX15_005042 [Rhizobium sp. BK650]|nr:hypothetical protein [Rhizobium sp. BK650]